MYIYIYICKCKGELKGSQGSRSDPRRLQTDAAEVAVDS